MTTRVRVTNSTRYNTEDLTALFQAVMDKYEEDGRPYYAKKAEVALAVLEAKSGEGIVPDTRRSWRRARRLGVDFTLSLSPPARVMGTLQEMGSDELPKDVVANLAEAMAGQLGHWKSEKWFKSINLPVRIEEKRSKSAIEAEKHMRLTRAQSLAESDRQSIIHYERLVREYSYRLECRRASYEKRLEMIERMEKKP